jgi:hypothetical protein
MAAEVDDDRSAYCLCCLGTVSPTSESCPHCRAPFMGAGSYQRVSGPAPKRVTSLLAPARMRAAIAA